MMIGAEANPRPQRIRGLPKIRAIKTLESMVRFDTRLGDVRLPAPTPPDSHHQFRTRLGSRRLVVANDLDPASSNTPQGEERRPTPQSPLQSASFRVRGCF